MKLVRGDTGVNSWLSGCMSVGWLSGCMYVGEMCLELFPQFQSHLNKTCYTWSLMPVDVHDLVCCEARPETLIDVYPYFL